MYFCFVPLTIEFVTEIDSWNYEGFIEEVGMDAYFESFNKTGSLTGPAGCDGYAAILEDQTAGLFEFTLKESSLEIGLALRPDLVGHGFGLEFVKQGIQFGLQQYDANLKFIRLVVSRKNEAAIRVYEKLGFQSVEKTADEIEMRLRLKG